MRIVLALLLFSVFFLSDAIGQNAEIRGFLYNKQSGEAIIYTNVYLKGTRYGVLTDVNGFYSINRIPAGSYTLMATSIGYDTTAIPVELTATTEIKRNLYLEERVKELEAVEITGSKSQYRKENTVNISVTQITPRDIKMTPSVGGEPDLVQYLTTLPGVVTTGDQGGQVFIRGGTLTQNLTLLDGMIVYNPFHSIGLYSVFDNDLIKSADFYTAGFGPEYGGRSSSVIDVKTIDGSKSKTNGNASISPIAGKLNVNGPILKTANGGTLTYIASGRRSILEQTAPIFYEYATKNGRSLDFEFEEYYGKLTLAAENGNKASVFGFSFGDRAGLNPPNNFKWRNNGAGANFLLLPGGSSTLVNATIAYSSYQVDVSDDSPSPRSSGVTSLNGGLDFTYYIGKSELKYGAGIVNNTTNYRSFFLTGERYTDEKYNTELFTYAKYRINARRLILDPGLRFHYYASLSTPSLEPRLGAKFTLTDKIRLKGAAGYYSQNLISTKSDREVINLFNGFLSSVEQVRDGNNALVNNVLQTSWQYVAGVEIDLVKNFEINLEGYIKDFGSFISVNSLRRSEADAEFIQESGLAKGIDLIARYDKRPYTAQISYSLAQVSRTFGNITYNPNYDRRHNVNILVSWQPLRNRRDLEINARFAFGTGLPFTQTQAFYEEINLPGGIDAEYVNQNGQLGIYYGTLNDFNKGRLPTYHRLDIGVKKYILFSKTRHLELSAGATNAYNRQNIFYIDRVNQARKIFQLPILPYFAVSAQF